TKTKDTSSFKTEIITVGDTLFYSKGFAVLEKINSRNNIPGLGFSPNDSASVATLKVFAKTESIYTIETLLINKGGVDMPHPDTLAAENLVIQLQKIKGDKAEFGIKESLKAYKFPFINLLWLGTIIMVTGIVMSMVHRIRLNRNGMQKI
ncbi:MAG: cytochrome c assembly protein, partial [Chitinophagaceae bacterium]